MQETRIRSLGGEDPLKKETATHSNSLAWEIPLREGSLVDYSPRGNKRMGHNLTTKQQTTVINNTCFFYRAIWSKGCFKQAIL